MLLKMTVALSTRIQELTSPTRREAGEGPVPYVIMVTVIAIGAAAIAAVLITYANTRLTTLP
ncbi:hypothetical protein F4553_002998 [Allocatelliglobosispora scoriae]|uniref:Uncharacterized protein n=1 Tax=Allocatelliglobosispora scoriae TaxID=643052 RepID=A0A841BR01_9ACTN|nr:hypothetical protein [Allocatelliglobosispora scoriae]MBB5869619.1 hypothetical protein [Allocatelliglobosispora scoriae]